MATITATLHGKQFNWESDAIFVANDQTNAFKNAQTVIHPRVAQAIGLLPSNDTIRVTIENKTFKFHTIVRNINADFWISYDPCLISYFSKRSNTLMLKHGRNSIDLPVPAVFNPTLFGDSPIKIPLDFLTIYFDGCCKNNPGYGGYGFAIYYGDWQVDETQTQYLIGEGFGYLSECTSNVSEYTGLIEALVQAKRLNAQNIILRGDSELVLKQISGEYKCRSPKLVPLYEKVNRLLQNFDNVYFDHVSRDENEIADSLANDSLRSDKPHFFTRYFFDEIREFRSNRGIRVYYH